VARGKLALAALKEDRFPKQADFPEEARGQSYVLRTETGKKVTLKIQSRDGRSSSGTTPRTPSRDRAPAVQPGEKKAAAKVPARKRAAPRVQSKERKK
jgi:hypothetical protein